MSNFHFKFMALCLKLRDLLVPPKTVVEEAGVKPGFAVLDFGCGPGKHGMMVMNIEYLRLGTPYGGTRNAEG